MTSTPNSAQWMSNIRMKEHVMEEDFKSLFLTIGENVHLWFYSSQLRKKTQLWLSSPPDSFTKYFHVICLFLPFPPSPSSVCVVVLLRARWKTLRTWSARRTRPGTVSRPLWRWGRPPPPRSEEPSPVRGHINTFEICSCSGSFEYLKKKKNPQH